MGTSEQTLDQEIQAMLQEGYLTPKEEKLVEMAAAYLDSGDDISNFNSDENYLLIKNGIAQRKSGEGLVKRLGSIFEQEKRPDIDEYNAAVQGVSDQSESERLLPQISIIKEMQEAILKAYVGLGNIVGGFQDQQKKAAATQLQTELGNIVSTVHAEYPFVCQMFFVESYLQEHVKHRIFSQEQITSLVNNGIRLSVAERYDTKKFTLNEINALAKEGINPSIVNAYEREFLDFRQIMQLAKAEVSYRQIKKYDKERFSTQGIVHLAERKIEPEKANNYHKRFCSDDGKDVIYLLENSVTAAEANTFTRFTTKEIVSLLKAGIVAKTAECYDGHLTGDGVIFLVQRGITPPQANGYKLNKKGCPEDCIAQLVEAGMASEIANPYIESFDVGQTINLVGNDIPHETANAYRSSLWEEDLVTNMIQLHRVGIDPKKSQEYRKLFGKNMGEMITAFRAGIRPEISQEYKPRFNNQNEYVPLMKAGIRPETAREYAQRFSGEEISGLFREGIMPEAANRYAEHFAAEAIKTLSRNKVPPDAANAYNKEFAEKSVDGIVNMNKEGITPEQANKYFWGLYYGDNKKNDPGMGIVKLIRNNVPSAYANWISNHMNGMPVPIIIRCFEERISPYDFLEFNRNGITNYYTILDHVRAQKAYEAAIKPAIMRDVSN